MKSTNRKIVNFIAKWISEAESMNSFATLHGIDEKTVRSIMNDNFYTISFITICRICEARHLKLHEFFKMVDV